MSRFSTPVRKLLPRGSRFVRLPVGIGRGINLDLDLRDGGYLGLYMGLYEVELNRHLRSLCRPGMRGFDLGGSIGYDALVMASRTKAPVLTVEADPELCARLMGNVAANPPLAHLVTVTQGFIDSSPDLQGHVTVDQLAERHFLPDLLKIDIEGGEVSALLGAARVLKARRPEMIIEVHSKELEDECIEILAGHRYAIKIVNQRRILPDHRPTPHNRWLVATAS